MTSSPEDPLRATIAAYEGGARAYAEHSRDRGGLAHLHRRFATLLQPGARILDLGCGPGHDAAKLADLRLNVVGCDPARGLLHEAREHEALQGRLIAGDGRQLPFDGESFDGVWACASLLHIPKSQVSGALSEVQRVLRVGGVLFTSMQEGIVDGLVATSDADPLLPRHYTYYVADE